MYKLIHLFYDKKTLRHKNICFAEPVCVVSIAGPCRAGKSYIIDEVFGQMEAFPVGHFTDPETTGIWMWISPQPFQV